MLIDVAISGDRNVIKKEAEKILKYKDLKIEIQLMWNLKTRVIPVTIEATGTIFLAELCCVHKRGSRSEKTRKTIKKITIIY
jgi:hypothetical protein